MGDWAAGEFENPPKVAKTEADKLREEVATLCRNNSELRNIIRRHEQISDRMSLRNTEARDERAELRATVDRVRRLVDDTLLNGGDAHEAWVNLADLKAALRGPK